MVIAACRPVVWTEAYQLPGTEPTPVYPGSIVGQCAGCQVAIWVGPRAQELTVPHVLACLLCAGRLVAGGRLPVRSLGNTYDPKPGAAP